MDSKANILDGEGEKKEYYALNKFYAMLVRKGESNK
jgi:hypothetical protein